MAENVYKGGRRKGFTTVYRAVAQDKRLSLKARGLFLLLQSLPEDWNYTISGLASMAGSGKDQIRSGLDELMKVGYLVMEQTHDRAGKFSGNTFVLQEEAPPLSGNPTTDFPTTEKPSSENPTEQNNNRTDNDRTEPPKAPQGAGLWELFDRFWAAYPRKQHRDRARKAWAKLSPDLALCRQMSAALDAQKRSDQWMREEGRYIPHPATWLNGRCWEDDPGPMYTPPDHPEIPLDDARRGRYL